MSKENSVSDSRAVYTPPCVVRISDLKQGAGPVPPQVQETADGCSQGMEILRRPDKVEPEYGFGNGDKPD